MSRDDQRRLAEVLRSYYDTSEVEFNHLSFFKELGAHLLLFLAPIVPIPFLVAIYVRWAGRCHRLFLLLALLCCCTATHTDCS
jgi:hypothetical protein